ncbi:2Fe-2S iron-sulfur cluster-binding protein [Geoalkalibacter sp.]|uniref:2Fe-2S iron-sulfur cluster-binding protein n=1 Tax=Geoalkalibacter sp. TaxID=3041440 RepID=UPI00272EB540|nr:2Fe-2S iron-sulfur cluster-binding protein [Geoalkalibacter sp.]
MITMELEGRKIRVPAGLTIIEALWDTGHEVKRGIGCLSGLCGACTVAYLEEGAQRVKFGLGCQTLVGEGMNVIMLPYFPSRLARYDMQSMDNPLRDLPNHYPELLACNDCKACNICPEWIDVAAFVRNAREGEYALTAEKVLDCHMCGLCASRCPKSIAPHYVGLYTQRSCARQQALPPNLENRLKEMESGRYAEEFAKILSLSDDELKDFCRKAL